MGHTLNATLIFFNFDSSSTVCLQCLSVASISRYDVIMQFAMLTFPIMEICVQEVFLFIKF